MAFAVIVVEGGGRVFCFRGEPAFGVEFAGEMEVGCGVVGGELVDAYFCLFRC